MKLIVFSGLPGTGKSVLAEFVGSEQKLAVFAKDWLEGVLKDSGIKESDKVGFAGYNLLGMLAERQLMLGQSVILDSVASYARIREKWRKIAQKYKAGFVVVECVCSNESLRRNRLSKRQRGIPGWHELSWDDVLKVKSYFESWGNEERLVVDVVGDLEENKKKVLEYIRES